MKKKLAIIGASTGQLPLYTKAREMGLETFSFAWEEGAVCRDYADHFFPISIFETDRIAEICRQNGIDGIISNASEATALAASMIAEKLDKPCTPAENLKRIQNKVYTRETTNRIEGLSPIEYSTGATEELLNSFPRPFVMKPVSGSAKKGVNYVDREFTPGSLPLQDKELVFFAEAFVDGREYSVESLSSEDRHTVVQITEKIGSGAPHFVELEHHQPACLTAETKKRIEDIIPKILTALGYRCGAAHTEIKINDRGEIFLIEVNPRGGGDYISSDLTSLSTDFDYLREMINVALGEYIPKTVTNKAFAGIYFLSAFTERLLPQFTGPEQDWLVRRAYDGLPLRFSTSNHDRNGYIIYCANEKVIIQ